MNKPEGKTTTICHYLVKSVSFICQFFFYVEGLFFSKISKNLVNHLTNTLAYFDKKSFINLTTGKSLLVASVL